MVGGLGRWNEGAEKRDEVELNLLPLLDTGSVMVRRLARKKAMCWVWLTTDARTGATVKHAWMDILPIVEIRTESGFAIAKLAAMNVGRSRVRVAHHYCVHLRWSIRLESCFSLIWSGI